MISPLKTVISAAIAATLYFLIIKYDLLLAIASIGSLSVVFASAVFASFLIISPIIIKGEGHLLSSTMRFLLIVTVVSLVGAFFMSALVSILNLIFPGLFCSLSTPYIFYASVIGCISGAMAQQISLANKSGAIYPDKNPASSNDLAHVENVKSDRHDSNVKSKEFSCAVNSGNDMRELFC